MELTNQLIVLISAILLIVVISITITSIARQSQNFSSELQERATITVESLDAAIINSLYLKNYTVVEDIADNFATLSDMLAVRVYDADGRILVATDDESQESLLTPNEYGLELLKSRGNQVQWFSDHLSMGRPIMVTNQTLGAVHIELSTASFNSQVQSNVLQGIIIAVLAVGFAIFVGFFVSRSLTTPVSALADQTRLISEGNLTKPITVQGGSSEIAELASTMEHMRGSLNNIYTDLENRVAQRTVELKEARDEALEAKRVADENSRLKSEFLSMMSHELRTPMNAIEGFTGILLERMAGVEFNDKSERFITKIQSNSQRLLALINDFLDLSRIESGRLKLEHQPITLADAVTKWKSDLSVLAENKGIEFTADIDSDLPTQIYGDEESLSKIMINLLGNAIKFTDEGRVSLKLEKRDGQLALEVKDTGIGIPPHARDFIFDEFRQVDMTSKRKHGGTGLGLAIVDKLARAMNGKVTLESEMGAGSTFTVLIPIHTQPEPN